MGSWRALYDKQQGRCAVCGQYEPINKLNVDHVHGTKQVRGLLCGHCNKALGLLRDDPVRVLNLHKYLVDNLRA